MRRLALCTFGAFALAGSTPALAAANLAEELTFTDGATPFDAGIPAFGGRGTLPIRVLEVFPEQDITAASLDPSTIAAEAGSTNRSTYRSAFNARVLAVPEPRTWLAMIVGLGVIGYTLRTRKRPLPQAV